MTEDQVREQLSQIALVFQRNDGQVDSRVKYLVRSASRSIFFTADEVTYTFTEALSGDKPDAKARSLAIKQKFVGSGAGVFVEGVGELPSKVNYFIGNDPSNWQTGVPTFSSIVYKSLYPGIDLAYSGKDGVLEYEFTIKPSVAPSAIQISFDGIKGLSINADGDLVVDTELEPFGIKKPVAYQWKGDHKMDVPVFYALLDAKTYEFKLGSYDHELPLIIE